MRRNSAVREKILYILAGAAFVLVALTLLYLLLRGTSGKRNETTDSSAVVAADFTPQPTAIPDGITIGGKTVSASADSFDLSGKSLSPEDMAGISSMTNLTTLSLSGCGITDVSFLAPLTSLRTLYLPGNSISDVTPLAALSNLSTLYLDNNPVTDLTPLRAITGLTTLSLQGVAMPDYMLEDFRSAMPNCRVFNDSTVETARPISLGGAAFTDDVTTLDLSNRGIGDISKLAYCLQLTELNLSGNPISGLSVLMGLPKLTSLNLSGTGLTDGDLATIKTLRKLTYLNVTDNDLSAEALDQLKAALPECTVEHDVVYYKVTLGVRTVTSDATELDLRYCAVEALAGLETFSELRKLEAPGNGISDLTPLAPCVKLEELDLSENRISSLSGIEGLTHLKTLRLSHNTIRDLHYLANLTELEELDLSYNNLDYLTQLASLTNLKTLNLTGNPALTAEQLRELQQALPGCTILTDLSLATPAPEADTVVVVNPAG